MLRFLNLRDCCCVGFVLQLVCVALNKVLLSGLPEQQWKRAPILHDRLTADFGNPVAEGVWRKHGTSMRLLLDSDARVVSVVGGYALILLDGSDRKRY